MVDTIDTFEIKILTSNVYTYSKHQTLSSSFMKKTIISVASQTCLFCIAIVLFYTAHSFAQSQPLPHGYGLSTYKAETKGQYMKHWLLAGPVKMTFTGTAPDMQAQELFFREDSS